MRELPSPGKSGSVFWISHDDRFFLKVCFGFTESDDMLLCKRRTQLVYNLLVLQRNISALACLGRYCQCTQRPLPGLQTMKRSEVDLLLKLLPRYYEHVALYPHTLLIKFFGLHRVTTANGGKVPGQCCLQRSKHQTKPCTSRVHLSRPKYKQWLQWVHFLLCNNMSMRVTEQALFVARAL